MSDPSDKPDRRNRIAHGIRQAADHVPPWQNWDRLHPVAQNPKTNAEINDHLNKAMKDHILSHLWDTHRKNRSDSTLENIFATKLRPLIDNLTQRYNLNDDEHARLWRATTDKYANVVSHYYQVLAPRPEKEEGGDPSTWGYHPDDEPDTLPGYEPLGEGEDDDPADWWKK